MVKIEKEKLIIEVKTLSPEELLEEYKKSMLQSIQNLRILGAEESKIESTIYFCLHLVMEMLDLDDNVEEKL